MLIGKIGFLIVLYASGSLIDDNICEALCINVRTLGGRESFVRFGNKLFECCIYIKVIFNGFYRANYIFLRSFNVSFIMGI